MAVRALIMDFGGVLDDPGWPVNEHQQRPLVDVVRHVRRAGLRTGLLSNADGAHRDPEWSELFDSVVLSGNVGLAKPDPRIYTLTASRLGTPVTECVFVDDFRGNVTAAVGVGMVGVHHRDVDATIDELATLFEITLR